MNVTVQKTNKLYTQMRYPQLNKTASNLHQHLIYNTITNNNHLWLLFYEHKIKEKNI
jgi:hypothetical protein